MPLTPEMKARIKAAGAKRTPDPYARPIQAVPTEVPDQAEADSALRNVAEAEYGRTDPGPDAQALAVQTVRAAKALPPDIPEKPDLGSETVRALLPHVTTRDNRPLSPLEQSVTYVRSKSAPEAAADIALAVPELAATIGSAGLRKFGSFFDADHEAAANSLADAIDPARLRSEARKGLEGLLPEDRGRVDAAIHRLAPETPDDLTGIATESGPLALLRILGSAAPALLTETAERVPTVDASKFVAGVRGASPATVLDSLTSGHSTVGREVLGLNPGDLQKVRRPENPVADWWQGVIERIDEGRGLEQDIALGFDQTVSRVTGDPEAGDTAGDVGWWIGLGADILTPWESMAIAPLAKAGRVVETGGRLAELTPKAAGKGARDAYAAALLGAEAKYGETFADAWARELEAGRSTLDDAPPSLRVRLEEVAQDRYGMTAAEVFRRDGIAASNSRSAAEPLPIGDEPRPSATLPDIAAPPAAPRLVDPSGRVATSDASPGQVPAGRIHGRRLGESPFFRRADPAPGSAMVDVMVDPESSGSRVPISALIAAEDATDVRIPTSTYTPKVEPPKLPASRFEADRARRRGPGEGLKRPEPPVAPRAELPDLGQLPSEDAFRAAVARLEQDLGPVALPDHAGFRALAGTGTQRAEDVAYELRNARGERIGPPGDLEATMRRAATRGIDGDVVWRGTQRRVASWSEVLPDAADLLVDPAASSRFELRPSRWFSSPEEASLVRERASARPALQVLHDAEDPAAATRGRALTQVVTRSPLEAAEPGAPTTVSSRLVRDAARLAVRDAMGSDRLVPLANGAMVTRADRDHIAREVDKALGVTPKQAEAMLGKATTPELEAKLDALVPQREARGTLTANDWTAARRRLLNDIGGVIADERYRVQGVAPLRQRFIDAFKDFHTDRRRVSAVNEAVLRNGTVGRVVSAFTEDVLERLPPKDRALMKRAKIAAHSNVDEFARELSHDIINQKLSASAAINQAIDRLRPVHPEHLTIAERILGDGPGLDQVDDLRAAWRGPVPSWLASGDPIVVSAGAERWARGTTSDAVDLAREWVQAHALVKNPAKYAEYSERAARLPEAEALAVYKEFVRGELAGPATKAAVESLGMKVSDDPTDALLALAIDARGRRAIADVVEQGLGSGFLLRASDTAGMPGGTLSRVVEGRHRTWNSEMGRYDYHITEAEAAWAERQLHRWGVEPGAGTVFETVRLGGEEIRAPAFLVEELRSLQAAGVLDSRQLTRSKAYNRLTRYFKEGITYGILAPRPSYFLGQMLGVLPTMVTTRGLGATTSALGRVLFDRPGLTGELVKRFGSVGFPTFLNRDPGSQVLRTIHGELIPIDDLERAARHAGLGETRTGYETAAQVQQVLSRAEHRSWWDWRSITAAPRWWQEQIRRFAGAADTNARMAAFLDEAYRGAPLEQAALTARNAVLDFGDLTPFESRWMRHVFTFYAFMRKNADAHLRALILHPERVLGQMRLAHASLTYSGLSGIELGSMRPSDLGGLAVYNDREVVNDAGQVHPNYRMNRVTSSSIGVSEALMQILQMAAPVADLVGYEIPGVESEDILRQVTPLGQTLALLFQGRRLEADTSSPYSNRIPPVLLDTPGLRDFLVDGLGIGPLELRGAEFRLTPDEDATAANGGKPSVWVAGGIKGPSVSEEDRESYRVRWQILQAWLGGQITQAQRVAETGMLGAVGVDEPAPPGLTQTEATWHYLLGLRASPVLTEREASNEALRARVKRTRAEINARRPPSDVPGN